MADVKWIKIATDMFDNRKIKQIEILPDGDAIIVIWVKILCLAGSINEDGCLFFTKEIPYTEELMATQFNRPINTVRLALKTFEQFGMIEVIDSVIRISNWEKYQNIEGMEKVREQTRNRVSSYRERQKQARIECVTLHETLRNATDKEKEEEKENNNTCSPEANVCTKNPDEVESKNSKNPKKKESESQFVKDFEIIYGIYPKKRGRTKAFAAYKLWVTKGKEVNGKRYKLTNRQIYKAVQKYVDQQERSGQDDYQYWKNFDTLMGAQLLDYVTWEE